MYPKGVFNTILTHVHDGWSPGAAADNAHHDQIHILCMRMQEPGQVQRTRDAKYACTSDTGCSICSPTGYAVPLVDSVQQAALCVPGVTGGGGREGRQREWQALKLCTCVQVLELGC